MNEKIIIEDDGTIIRNDGNSRDILLNIMRVGANKQSLLAAYKARKKCYEIVKESTKRVDYKEYVESIMLDNYPNEFKKAELGLPFLIYLVIFLLSTIVFLFCLFNDIFEHVGIFIYWEYDGYGHYMAGLKPGGVIFMVILLIISIISGIKTLSIIKLINSYKSDDM